MKRILTALALGTLAAGALAQAQTLRPNPGFNAKSIPRNDDGSSGLEPLGFTINLFGKTRSAAFVNNNGNLTFDSALATYTPFGLAGTQREIIAPFFGDVDTRPDASKLVTYGQDTVNGHKAFGANYISVGYYNVHFDKLNSFQVVLIDRSDTGSGNFDIEFNYAQIRWETGDASGGVGGYGGVPAAVGWSNGTADPNSSFELPGSRVAGQFLDNGPRALVRLSLTGVVQTAGTTGGVAGRLVFRARDGVISPGLQITNGLQLPDATVGANYSTTLAATGSKGPFRWSVIPDVASAPGLTFNTNGQVTGVPTTAGTYSFTVSVTASTEDGDVTVVQRGSITVRPPTVSVLTACPLDDATVGRPYSLALRAAGATGGFTWSIGDPYSLPPGVALSAAGQLAGTPRAPGTYLMTFKVRGNGNFSQQTAQTSCRLNVLPAAVRLSSGCALRATVSVPYSQLLTPDGGIGPYRFTVLGQLPYGLALSDSGAIAGTAQASGVYPFTLQTTDSQGAQSTQNCNISVDDVAFSVSQSCPLPSGSTGAAYDFQLPAAYTWSLSGGTLPTGVSLTPDGKISGTPMTAGPSHFNLLATDSGQHQVGQACSLVVNRGPLSISGCPVPDAAAGEAYTTALSPMGGNAPYFFSLLGGLPDGMELTTDGVLHGSTTVSGSFSFSVLLREGSGQTVTQACNLAVTRPALRITSSCPLPDAQLGQTYAARLNAAGGLAPYRFDFSGFLPDGLTAAADGSITGVAQSVGGRSFLIKVTDSKDQSVTSICSLNVGLPAAPDISLLDMPATVAPASSTLAVTVQLAKAYAQTVEGTLTLDVHPDTSSPEAEANQADPRLRFANGQLSINFSLAPGQTRASFPIASTGTVASTVTVSMSALRTAGVALTLLPPAQTFRILRAAPVVTSACYQRNGSAIELRINGLSTTRELDRADVGAGGKLFITDISGVAAGYYASPDTIRAGGTFSLKLPYELGLTADQPVGDVSMNLYNIVGAIQIRPINPCQ